MFTKLNLCASVLTALTAAACGPSTGAVRARECACSPAPAVATAKARTAQADSPCTAPGKVLDSSVVAPATVRLAMMVRPFEFEVDRELLSELERDDATWGARLVLQEGKVEGFAFHVFGVRPDTIAGRLGFENGDAVVAINRTPLMSLDQARQAYLSATRAQVIVVTVERQGTSLDLTYHLTQAPPAAK